MLSLNGTQSMIFNFRGFEGAKVKSPSVREGMDSPLVENFSYVSREN